MTAPRTEPSTPDQAWGAAPAPARPGWSPGKKIGIGVAAAVVLAAGGGAAVWAATNSSSGTGSTAIGGAMRGPGALGGALHGEYVASDGNGGYVTKIMQSGKVTALSATSLTAQSDDGFSKTYTISGSQATGVATGDTVMVVATTSGDTATATQVTEAGQMGGPGQGQLGG